MDEDVDVARQLRNVGQITGDNLDAVRQQCFDGASALNNLGEDVFTEQLLDAIFSRELAFRAHQHRGACLRTIIEERPQHLLTDEPGDARHGDLLACQKVFQPPVE